MKRLKCTAPPATACIRPKPAADTPNSSSTSGPCQPRKLPTRPKSTHQKTRKVALFRAMKAIDSRNEPRSAVTDLRFVVNSAQANLRFPSDIASPSPYLQRQHGAPKQELDQPEQRQRPKAEL